ncbi:ABC transporter permease [Herbiconiux sp. KACC 21604]|uniref:ABC transporter permease n=1 Tax=unclassified Herbiconiux TaxID=2618217 RepID=UPI00149107A2|nr:ABC transporter permease [Herbiconiux sp. SALV-R1]QJU52352.1 ABC transporter permease [Herbiconiux sp. SALV-R1]WPO87208.1 ABC transporter permease [Herbiconiux sp. KACC 21604]
MSIIAQRTVHEGGAALRLPPRVAALIFVREQGLLVLWLLLIVIFAITGAPHFFTLGTGVNVLNAAAITSIFAAGLGIGVMTGVLDLSVPGTAAVVGVSVALLIKAGAPVWLALVVGLVIGAVVGVVNGLIAIRGFDPLIVTIGMLSVLSGTALLLAGGYDITGMTSLAFLGTERYLEIPAPVYISVVLFVVLTVMLKFTRVGTRLLAVGGNAEGARRVGIRTEFYRVLGFVISAVCAAIGGIVNTAYISIAQPAASTGVIFTALTAVALAGVPFVGGRGSLPKVFLGTVVLATISAGLLISGVPTFWATIATGVLLIGALALNKGTGESISRLLLSNGGMAGKRRPS